MVTKTIMHLGINFQKCTKPKLSKPQMYKKTKKEQVVDIACSLMQSLNSVKMSIIPQFNTEV